MYGRERMCELERGDGGRSVYGREGMCELERGGWGEEEECVWKREGCVS